MMTKTQAEAARILQSLRAKHLVTERDHLFSAELSRLFEYDEEGRLTHRPVLFTRGTETHGITFIEGSGGGKTTAILEVLRNFEPLKCNPETGAPRWLHVSVESPATLRSLGISILSKLGVDHISERAKVYEIWAWVRHGMMRRGICLLWIDEAHDIFQSNLVKETDHMFKMIKTLMQGDHPVVLVLSGTQRLSQLTSLDPQVNRRFAKIRPGPLRFAEDRDSIEGLVAKYAEYADLESVLEGEDVARLIYASRYRFGRCVELINRAIEIALSDGSNVLGLDAFEIAYGQSEGCDIAENVFAAPDWQAIELPDDEDAIIARRAADVRNPNKKKGRSQ